MPSVAASGGRPAPTVDQRAAFEATYKLLLRSVATPGRLVAIAALAGVSILTALAVNASSPPDRLEAAVGYVNANLSTLVPVAVLVFGAATLGDLIDDGSLVYLWLRPVPPRVYVVAAWAATVTIAVPLVGAPIVLATVMVDADSNLLVATVVGALVAISAYSALFVMGGIRFRRALPWGLVYILIWEGFVASAGETAAKLAIRSYVRSILAQQTGEDIKLAEFTLASGIIVPLVVTVVALAYAARRLARTDVA
ncbi:MAG TPA: hypothetical protein VHK88_08550 [Aquihabitans sp.]|nr:hypothetical protein [Aquihabitans sp.]